MAELIEQAPAATPDKPLGPTPSEVADYWLKELGSADRHETKWRDRAKLVIQRYRDESENGTPRNEDSETRYNILYSNTEVLKGVMYQKKPVPDVRRRFLDKDPVGREAAKVLERALSFSIDSYDFDGAIESVVEDVVLPGRGQARVKYIPTFAKVPAPPTPVMDPLGQPAIGPDGQPQTQPALDPQGQPLLVDELVYQEVTCDYVEWEMFRYSPAKRWSKVRWVAFGELLSREDLTKQFPAVAALVTLNWKPEGNRDGYEDDIYKRALVWTIWDKTKRQCVVITEGYKDGPLTQVDDPLKLEGFFPCPRPVYAIKNTNTLVPVPFYVQYQDQAEELNDLSERITVLTNALRRRGCYNGARTELAALAKAGDNEFIPVIDWAALIEKGGLEGQWAELDISVLAKVLIGLYEQREQCKQIIYEQGGIADIMRGSTKATETLGAQQLKSNYATLRTDPMQGDVQRFIRDLLRIKAEIIAEHFSPETLAQMTNIQLPTPQEKAAAQQVVTMAIQQGAPLAAMGMPPPPIPPDMLDAASRPTWDEVMAVLKSDKLRGFRVDIETDSTIKPDADTEQRNRIELLTALTGFLEKVLPGVQMGLIPRKVATELTLFGVRAFKVGPALEEVLTQWADGQLDPPSQIGMPMPGAAPGQPPAPGQPQPEQQPRPQLRPVAQGVA